MKKYVVLKISKGISHGEVIVAENAEQALQDILSVDFNTVINIGKEQSLFDALGTELVYAVKEYKQ